MPPNRLPHHTTAWAASNLAARLLAGPWSPLAIAAGVTAALGPLPYWTCLDLVMRILALADGTYPPAPHVLTSFLVHDEVFAPTRDPRPAAVLTPPLFAPAKPFTGLPIPALPTLGDLGAWLDLSPGHLDWLTGQRGGHDKPPDGPLRHYRYAFVAKRSGATRLIEAPKPHLKAIQRRILREILSPVPVHDCAKGFIPGRSCLGGAQIHAGEAIVMTLDLSRFFPSIGLPRIHGLFRKLGYPWGVARALTGLCTTVTPKAVLAQLGNPDDYEIYGRPHLPQGAPSSPALANLATWTLDRRLHGLARAAGANYTRYADDLAFSGDTDFAGRTDRFRRAVETIVEEEGFRLNAAKTRVMPRSARQTVTGIVVNAHCNVRRTEFDALKATLFNCARHGPDSQNRAGVPDFRRHLDGRIAWVEQVNPPRGAKLRALFERIVWA
jgi:hypothetical protein